MRSGDLKHFLTFQASAETSDGGGSFTTTWSDVYECRGAIWPLGSKERLDAMKLLIEDMYNTRGTEIIGQGFTVSRLKTVEALLTPHRIPSTYIGLQGLYK